jgi:hypothetical protein
MTVPLNHGKEGKVVLPDLFLISTQNLHGLDNHGLGIRGKVYDIVIA